jgi:hypothetical protein
MYAGCHLVIFTRIKTATESNVLGRIADRADEPGSTPIQGKNIAKFRITDGADVGRVWGNERYIHERIIDRPACQS